MVAGKRIVARLLAALFAASLAGGATTASAADLPPGFVRLADVAPRIRQDMRYAGADNFLGRQVAGYETPDCWLRREAADALKLVASDLARIGWTLIVYDCYRPQRAVADFVDWSQDLSDQRTKPGHYPGIEKSRLFALGYIAKASSHSKGVAVDVGAGTEWGASVDFGTPFDFFDPRSAPASGGVSELAAQNRKRLAAAFTARGFRPLAEEWWHFVYPLADARAYDAPITR